MVGVGLHLELVGGVALSGARFGCVCLCRRWVGGWLWVVRGLFNRYQDGRGVSFLVIMMMTMVIQSMDETRALYRSMIPVNRICAHHPPARPSVQRRPIPLLVFQNVAGEDGLQGC